MEKPLYFTSFSVTVPGYYPDVRERLDTLINFYFREYEYIECEEHGPYKNKRHEDAKNLFGIVYTLTFFK